MNDRLAALEIEKPDTESALSYSREFEVNLDVLLIGYGCCPVKTDFNHY